jgi:phosphatidylserine/phosphatidylglycerophosphate/cardiolipin synthase-like enzyme
MLENVFVLHDPAVAQRYGQEWERFWRESEEIERDIDSIKVVFGEFNDLRHGHFRSLWAQCEAKWDP